MELITLKDYFKRFFEILPNEKSSYDAYLKLEDEYFEKYGRENYSNYNAFVKAKSRFIKSGCKWDRAK